jgi:hypothetical protein
MQNKIAPKKNIEEAIIEVVAFFDIFSYPLTVMEVWQFVGVKCDFDEISDNLELLKKKGCISGHNGYFFLPGREEIIRIKMERYNYSYKKFKKIKKIAAIFSYIPWIKLIAVGNSIGFNNSGKESDIDLLIVASKNRLWISRFFCVLIAMALRQRPSKTSSRDKVCLSFFVSERMLDFKPLLLGGREPGKSRLSDFPDPYFLFWLACLMPIYDTDDTYKELMSKNEWLSRQLPNHRAVKPVFIDLKRRNGVYYGDIIDLFIGGLDDFLRKLQIRLFPPLIKEKLNKDTCVMAGKDIIKLHSNDRREIYLNKYSFIMQNANLKMQNYNLK